VRVRVRAFVCVCVYAFVRAHAMRRARVCYRWQDTCESYR